MKNPLITIAACATLARLLSACQASLRPQAQPAPLPMCSRPANQAVLGVWALRHERAACGDAHR